MESKNYSYQVAVAANQNIKERDYWLEKLSGPLVKTGFPYDFNTVESPMKTLEFALDGDLYSRLMALSSGSAYTLHIVLAAGLMLLLAKYSQQRDILIGSPIYKQKKEMEFINTVLVLRERTHQNMSFRDLLLQVKQTVIQAAENQNYPFRVLMKRLDLPTPLSPAGEKENPLFDVALMLENLHEKNYIQGSGYKVLFSFLRTDTKLTGQVEYHSGLYREDTIARITRHFIHIINACVMDVNLPLEEVPLLDEEEKNRLLQHFCNSDADNDIQGPHYPTGKSVIQLFLDQVSGTPDHIAVVGQNPESSAITYRELNRRAHGLACGLRERGAGADTIVGVILPPSIEMIAALWGILAAGAAYLPIAPECPAHRIDFMLKDSHASILLKDQEIDAISSPQALIDLSAGHPLNFPSSHLPNFLTSPPANLAYVIYTSGSTGKPKGVLVQHGSLVNYLAAFDRQFPLGAADTVIHLSDYTFDAFVEEFYPVLLKGGKIVIPGEDQYLDIHNLGLFILRHGVTFIDCSPLLLNELNKLDYFYLENVHTFISGGDVLRSGYVDRLAKTAHVYNTYGPTETTVCATYYRYKPGEDTGASIPIGKPIAHYGVYITDPHSRLLPVGITGEIRVSGPGVTRGYLNHPEMTSEKFISLFNRSYKSYRTYFSKNKNHSFHSPLYKTGDLGRWLWDGNIQYSGRIDHQVKIRGFRIETGEIETLLSKREEIKEAAVIARERKNDEKYLCAYWVPADEAIDRDGLQETEYIPALKKYLIEKLPDYMVPSFFVRLEKLPLTPSGKVDRKALPEPEIKTSVQYTAPRNEVETYLQQIWMEVFSLERIGIDDNFFEIGGHSLNATVIISKIHKAFNINLPLAEVFRTPTIRQLAAYVQAGTPATEPGDASDRKNLPATPYTAITPLEKKEYYPLSSAQKRLFILQQMDPESTVYNMPQLIPLEHYSDLEKLEQIFKKLIRRHESFRTSFEILNGEAMQRVHDEVAFEIELNAFGGQYPKSQEPRTESYIKDFIRPFDLSHAPQLRVGFIKKQGDNLKSILLLDLHHIISDGLSHTILENDFRALFQGMDLPPLHLRYKDFTLWQNSPKEKQRISGQELYWLQQYAGEIPVLSLPLDFPRPRIQRFTGDYLEFEIPAQTTGQLKAAALQEKVTLFMVLLSVFNILLSRLCNQNDIVIGTVVSGRQHADLEKIIGMFVNTLPLRNNLDGQQTCKGFLKDLNDRTLQAFANQEYPFEELVEKVMVKRDASRNPLFDTVFSYHSLDRAETAALENEQNKPGKTSPPDSREYDTEHHIAKFDLTLHALAAGERLYCGFQYCTGLFKKQTVERFITYFSQILTRVAGNPSIRMDDLEMITTAEKEQVLLRFNRPYHSHPGDKSLHELFNLQAQRTPDQMALSGQIPNRQVPPVPSGENHLTYRELKEKADGWAYPLKEKGARPGTIVAIMVERSTDLIIGLLAILKTGAAYLPINPGNPQERIEYLLKDSKASILLKDHDLSSWLASTPRALLNRSAGHPFNFQTSPPSSLAYLIYTSGSTGRPKGVPITHANLCPLLHWGYLHLGIGTKDRTLQNLAYYFDWSVWEIFITLTTGACLYLAPGDVLLNPGACIAFMNRHAVTVLHVTPTQYGYLVREERQPGSLRYLFIGAEKLTYDLVRRSLASVSEDCRVFNMYGPTEATIISAVLEIHRRDYERFQDLTSVPIGVPAANATLLILDRYLKLCPVHITGELFIGGPGLAPGYLNNPELTAERFISHDHKSYKSNRTYISKNKNHSPHPTLNTRHSTLYKTGDLARWLEDGNVEFLGRVDFQVKIRGFRIELGEIENRLLEHPNIKQALVLNRQDPQQENYLCAYIVPTSTGVIAETALLPERLKEFLSTLLPDYMIPTYYMALEKIPLNPNGKVDLTALPEPGPTTANAYIPPTTPLERQLVEIWAEVLNRDPEQPPIGIEDDFFQLGGHSLKATVVLSKIHQQCQVKIPLIEIFKTPTIRQLGQYIQNETGGILHTTDKQLVLIKKNSAPAAPFFLIHEGRGEVEGYIELCRQVNSGFNYWSIKADRLLNYTPQNLSIEEIARNYLRIVKTLQDHGPYYFTGWSIGGTIAFEMTRQLEQENEQINFLALIDTAPPDKVKAAAEQDFTRESELNLIRYCFNNNNLIERLEKISSINRLWPETLAYLEETPLALETFKKRIPAALAQTVPQFDQLGSKELIHYLNIMRNFDHARNLYIPQEKINTALHLFIASQSAASDEERWKPYCRARIIPNEIQGNHYTIMRKPAVETLAKIFAQVLTQHTNTLAETTP